MEEMGVTTPTIDVKKYGRLLAKTLPAVIHTEAENERMLEQIEALMDKGEKRSSAEDRLLELMVKLVEDFEAGRYTIEESSPAEVLAYLSEQRGIRQTDLLLVLGCSKSFMSEMVSGRREI